MSIFTDMLGQLPKVPSAKDLPTAKDALRRLTAEVQDKVGDFMKQKLRIMDLQQRATTLSRINKTQANAIIHLSKAESLLADQERIEKTAISKAQEAGSFYSQLQNDPFWKNVSTANLSVLGTASLSRITAGVKQAASLARSLTDVKADISAHMRSIDQLEADISADEAYAQGRGIRGAVSGIKETVSGVGGWYQGMFGKPLMVFAAVAALAIFGLPMPRRLAASNPSRRRRRRG